MFLPDGAHTVIVSEEDLTVDIHVMANDLRQKAVSAGVDSDVEIFEWAGDLPSASIEGARRAASRLDPQRSYYETLRDWAIPLMNVVKARGLISTKDPSPLPKEAIIKAFTEAMKHPFYKGQVLQTMSADGEVVRVSNEI